MTFSVNAETGGARENCYSPNYVLVEGREPRIARDKNGNVAVDGRGAPLWSPAWSQQRAETRVLDRELLIPLLHLPALHQRVILAVHDLLSYVSPSEVGLLGKVGEDGTVTLTKAASKGRAWYAVPDRCFVISDFSYDRLRKRMCEADAATLVERLASSAQWAHMPFDEAHAMQLLSTGQVAPTDAELDEVFRDLAALGLAEHLPDCFALHCNRELLLQANPAMKGDIGSSLRREGEDTHVPINEALNPNPDPLRGYTRRGTREDDAERRAATVSGLRRQARALKAELSMTDDLNQKQAARIKDLEGQNAQHEEDRLRDALRLEDLWTENKSLSAQTAAANTALNETERTLKAIEALLNNDKISDAEMRTLMVDFICTSDKRRTIG